MNNQEVYNQIEEFNFDIQNNKETRTNKFYYMDSKEAQLKAKFIDYILKDRVIKGKLDSIENVMDLCFGSGNLTTHILLHNDINYSRLILNDYFLDDCNQELSKYLENCELTKCNFFDESCFEENSVDLLIFNPTHGGTPSSKNFVSKENKDFEALNNTLSKLLTPNAIVIFRGWKEDFNELMFSNFKYQKIYLDDNQSLYVCYDIDEKKKECFEYDSNEFEENEDCQVANIIEDDEEQNISDLIDKLNEKKVSSDIACLTNKEETQNRKSIKFLSSMKGNKDWDKFPYKNLLFKGVPGTGKSRAIDTIITEKFGLDKNDHNVLRINIHSASSNSDLMQGIGISSDNGNIQYSEKQGLILDIIKRATLKPKQPFVLILEEIQENSLNELIGDLIYLIEKDKRAKLVADDKEHDSYEKLVNKLVAKDSNIHYVEIPYLVNDKTDYKKMIMPDNLFIFCTSNYRDDKKIIEDNLLRRFEVIEIYPKNQEEMKKDEKGNYYFKDKKVSDFLENLNASIRKVMQDNHEIHPDRYMIGHAIWKDVDDKISFYRAFLKLITEFKDIREIEFKIFEDIIKKVNLPEGMEVDMKEIESYFDLIQDIQNKIGYDFLS